MAEQLNQDFKMEVRAQAVQQAVKWSIAAIAGLFVIAATGWWFYLKPLIAEGLGGVPTGAIIAFDVSNGCPSGWARFDEAAGRAIVGAGHGNGLTERRYRNLGGSESVVLTANQLPSHEHPHEDEHMGLDNNNDIRGRDFLFAGGADIHLETFTVPKQSKKEIRENSPLPIMGPYIALHYCKKSG